MLLRNDENFFYSYDLNTRVTLFAKNPSYCTKTDLHTSWIETISNSLSGLITDSAQYYRVIFRIGPSIQHFCTTGSELINIIYNILNVPISVRIDIIPIKEAREQAKTWIVLVPET